MTPASLSALVNGDMDNFMAASTPGGIEAQEKRGQLDQATKQTLPLDLRKYRESFEALGFEFGGTVEGIFQEAKFPTGWRKVPTDHSMWSDILDAKGRKRGAIFYKAAFYDRTAHAHLLPRFHVSKDYEHEGPDVIYRVFDACGVVEKRITGLPEADWGGDRDRALAASRKQDDAAAELTAWLDAEFPDWNNPAKHWV